MLYKHFFAIGMTLALAGSMMISTAFAEDTKMKAPTMCAPINEKMVAGFFDAWNKSLQTKNPDAVVANYADNGVLLATISNTPRTNHAEIRDYFVDFLKKSPSGEINQRVVRFGCNWATDTGVYTFTLHDNGKTKQVAARYSYVYEYIDGKWQIINHHSSMMPEPSKQEDIGF